MAVANLQKKLPVNLLPGTFTGIYTGTSTQLVPLKQASQIFSEELEKANKENSKDGIYTNAKLQNLPNSLPFTSNLLDEVSFYGLRWGRLDLCQYYKKSNPSPKYF